MTSRSTENRPSRRRPSAWPTVFGAIALFAIVFQLIAFQPTASQVSSGVASGKAKPAVVAVAPTQAPAPVVSSTS
jgi:hypothetical protein